MANIYDRVIKEVIEPGLKALVEILFNISYQQAQELKDKIQFTLEREGDLFKILHYHTDKTEELLHLEFHGKDEPIGKNMLIKKAMLLQKDDLKIRQYVIYLGDKDEVKYLEPHFKDDKTTHFFEVIHLKKIS